MRRMRNLPTAALVRILFHAVDSILTACPRDKRKQRRDWICGLQATRSRSRRRQVAFQRAVMLLTPTERMHMTAISLG